MKAWLKSFFRNETFEILDSILAANLKKYRQKDSTLLHDGRIDDNNSFETRDIKYDIMFNIPDIRRTTYLVRTNLKLFLLT